MRTIDLFKEKAQCCGCELCSHVCPKHLITMKADEEGFLYPFISSEDNCINCKRCISVCPVKSVGRKGINLKESFGGYCFREEDIIKSSSGGFATAISKNFILNGGVVIGVKYSDDFQSAEYAVADSISALDAFRTSKYIQAHKGNIYEKIRQIKDKKILFIGLPCEVSAVYHYIGAKVDNLYTISLICHGPTSSMIQKEFCDILFQKYKSSICNFSVRYKKHGWKPYFLYAKFSNGYTHEEIFKGSDYEIGFQYLKRPSCYSCKYKLGDKDFGLVADLTLGDFHAVEEKMQQYNRWGVSQASIQSEKGRQLLDLIKKDCLAVPIPNEIIKNYNYAFHHAVKPKKERKRFKKLLLKKGLHYAANDFMILLSSYIISSKRRIKSLAYHIKEKVIHK